MSDGELLSDLDAIDAEIARLQTLRLHDIAELHQRRYAQAIGARDTADLLARRYRLDRGQARRDVQLASALTKYPAVAEALPDTATPVPPPDGTPSTVAPQVVLYPGQAQAIVAALERVPTSVPIEEIKVAEEQLVGLGAHLSPMDLQSSGQRIRDLLDADGPEPEEHKAAARESLVIGRAVNGVKFRGFLANENAERLRALIHANSRPHRTLDGELDPRSLEKRQADGLSTVLSIAEAAMDVGIPRRMPSETTDTAPSPVTEPTSWVPGFGAKGTLSITIDFNDLKAATAHAIGDTVYGDGLSAASVRRIACDAKVIPIVLGSDSEPLDVGRSERLVTRGMRRALNARDRGCVVCGAPPIMCDAHHLRSWIDGGVTAIHNLVLLCRQHHSDLHAGHWRITITDGTVQVAQPAWANPPGRPRLKPSPPPSSPTPPGEAAPQHAQNRPGDLVPREVNPASGDAVDVAIWGEVPALASGIGTRREIRAGW
ncbi:HNH endonuclease signature motif containing protein [Kribbella sandramycini]